MSLVRLMLLILSCTTHLSSAQTANVQVPVEAPWYDTGIDVIAGQRLTIVTYGWVVYGSDRKQIGNADGLSPFTDGLHAAGPGHVLPEAVTLSLIGKIGGTTEAGTGTTIPQAVSGRCPGTAGTSYTALMTSSGRLFLGYNDQLTAFNDNSGSFFVQVTVNNTTPAANVACFTSVEITWPSVLDTPYVVQVSTDLQTNNWADFAGLIKGTGSALSVFDTTRDKDKKFYRVLSINTATE